MLTRKTFCDNRQLSTAVLGCIAAAWYAKIDPAVVPMTRVYFDYAATTPTDPQVLHAMKPFLTDVFGNPSSIHYMGRKAKSAVDRARAAIAATIGARPEEICFTGSGTESDNLAVKGAAGAGKKRGNHIITSAIEHHAVLESCAYLEQGGFRISRIAVDGQGLVDPAAVRKAICAETILISIMHANNEIGVIEPIEEIGAMAGAEGICFHSDAVQTFGHIPIRVDDLGVDLLSLSAHKLCGPKGIGALYVRAGTKLEALVHGGGQERGLRASTENVPAIVGFGEAAEIAHRLMQVEAADLRSLQTRLIDGLLQRIPHVRLNGHRQKRLPGHVNVSIMGVSAEAVLLNLNLEGIAASSGSACATGSLTPSHVILALGLPATLADGSLRFTMGRNTTTAHVDALLEGLPRMVRRLRAISPTV